MTAAGTSPEASALEGTASHRALAGTAASVFERRPAVLLLVLLILFATAAAARMYRLDAPGVLVDRDYTSAVLARDFYFQASESIEPWRKHVAAVTAGNQPILEPPVTEWLASMLYRVYGREDMRLGRLLTASFWLAGGLFFFGLARSLAPINGAVDATAYYLLAPTSILVSRSFQADALMMLLFVASLLAVVRSFARPSVARLLSAALLSGMTILYRPLVLFGILGAFFVATVHQRGLRRAIMDKRAALFVCISLAPALAYYGYGTFIGEYFGWKLQSSFQPHLLLHQEYWLGWRDLAIDAVGPTFAAASLIGSVWLGAGLPRAIISGLVFGYCVFGLVFTMHIHTHGYYHAQLLPIVAITAGMGAVRVRELLRGTGGSRYWWIPLAGVVMIAAHATAGTVRDRLAAPTLFETPAAARTIGELVGHSTRVVYLSRYYGMPLQYHGELTGAYWPRRLTYYLHPREGDVERSIQDRLDDLPFVPEYFVITAFEEFEKHHADLREYLESRCTTAAEAPEYLIYRACRPPDAAAEPGRVPQGLPNAETSVSLGIHAP